MPCIPTTQAKASKARNLGKEFPNGPLRMLAGGASGAYVFLVPYMRKGRKIQVILKFYPNAYKQGGGIDSDRPFRELLTICKLSGHEGFTDLYDKYVALTPVDWIKDAGGELPKQKLGLVAIFARAPGVPLSKMNPKALTKKLALEISLTLAERIAKMRKLMKDFRHYDFHPGNILVDTKQRVPMRFAGYSWTSPMITIIDFDLATFKSNIKAIDTNRTNVKHLQKKYLPGKNTVSFLSRLTLTNATRLKILVGARLQQDPDLREWYITLRAMLAHAHQDANVVSCDTPEQCVYKNSRIFDQLASVERRVAKRAKPDMSAAKIAGKGFA